MTSWLQQGSWRGADRRIGAVGACVASLVVGASAATYALHQVVSAGARPSSALLTFDFGAQSPPSGATTRGTLFADDAWSAKLRSQTFWSGRHSSGSGTGSAGRSGLTKAPSEDGFSGSLFGAPSEQGRNWYSGSDNTHRTMCVRLCDGYFWPISFSTTSDHFARDAQVCERSCGSGAKLYVYRNPGGEIDDMVDIKGQFYRRLRTAFRFRTTYDESCKCKPHAWEQDARDRHRIYALEAQKRKGSRTAARELELLKAGRAGARVSVKATRMPDADQAVASGRPEKQPAASGETPVVPPKIASDEAADTLASNRQSAGAKTRTAPANGSSGRRSMVAQDWRQKILEAR